ncbi:hypothetical protein MNBD_GAMMA06-717 [hydrothermal vent metagenome]|uniref:Type 4 fimbrial biogenesis protein PilX N-terminal domain-containing protein n=1 Tax=hydrothermal vent metagenome TaxID=652676 RepID=A0A3B0WBW8_9ZZZZ
MPTIKQKNRMQNKQSGFVLILALVLLTVMTLIGVSSMNSASIELKATANARQHQRAFNDAYSLLEYTLSEGAKVVLGGPINYQTVLPNVQSVASPATSNNTAGSIVYAGCASGVGNSLQKGKGFTFNFYSVSTNRVAAPNAPSALLSQGARFPSASCG